MSQDESKPFLNLNLAKIQSNSFKNTINNLEITISEPSKKENLNNLLINTSFLNKNLSKINTENNRKNLTLSSYNSENLAKFEETPNSFILLLYKELISLIKNSNTNLVYYKNEYNKIKNILNNNNNTHNIYETIIDIYKNTLIKIIEEKNKEIYEYLNQYKSYILLLEKDNRYYIQQNFLKQTKIDILESEIDSYLDMEEEFDEMKEKLKYENGKFLHNAKKENEILILRAENSNLKKVIDKNEKTIEEKEHIIETIKKSASMYNSNNNTIKNSFDFNEGEYNKPSSLIYIKNNKKNKFSKKANISNFKSYNIIQRMKSPKNNLKTNNNTQSSKNINFGETNINFSKGKINNLTAKTSNKELISKKIKNNVFNMKKIRRINDSLLGNYNKSLAYVSNSIMSNNSNNSSNKRLKKNINSFFKKNIFNGNNKIHKKLSSGMTHSNLNNLIKNHSNKIIVNSILDNNSTLNNNSYFSKTCRKKFGIFKKTTKICNIKNPKEDYILIRNNNSLIKSPMTFNNINIDSKPAMKNNIIINNIIQNSNSVPISAASSKSKEKINIHENEISQRIKNDKINKYINIFGKKDKNNNKSSGHLSVNIRKKTNKII